MKVLLIAFNIVLISLNYGVCQSYAKTDDVFVVWFRLPGNSENSMLIIRELKDPKNDGQDESNLVNTAFEFYAVDYKYVYSASSLMSCCKLVLQHLNSRTLLQGRIS